MPAATTKADLIRVTEKDWGKLLAVMDKLSPQQAMRKRDDDISAKDVIAHRAHWIHLFLGWYNDGQAGREVHIPAKDYKWNQLKAYNAALRERQSGLNWDEARRELTDAHASLMGFVEGHDDAALYGGPMRGGGANKWTPGRFCEASGASHYRSATKFLRKILREDAG